MKVKDVFEVLHELKDLVDDHSSFEDKLSVYGKNQNPASILSEALKDSSFVKALCLNNAISIGIELLFRKGVEKLVELSITYEEGVFDPHVTLVEYSLLDWGRRQVDIFPETNDEWSTNDWDNIPEVLSEFWSLDPRNFGYTEEDIKKSKEEAPA